MVNFLPKIPYTHRIYIWFWPTLHTCQRTIGVAWSFVKHKGVRCIDSQLWYKVGIYKGVCEQARLRMIKSIGQWLSSFLQLCHFCALPWQPLCNASEHISLAWQPVQEVVSCKSLLRFRQVCKALHQAQMYTYQHIHTQTWSNTPLTTPTAIVRRNTPQNQIMRSALPPWHSGRAEHTHTHTQTKFTSHLQCRLSGLTATHKYTHTYTHTFTQWPIISHSTCNAGRQGVQQHTSTHIHTHTLTHFHMMTHDLTPHLQCRPSGRTATHTRSAVLPCYKGRTCRWGRG